MACIRLVIGRFMKAGYPRREISAGAWASADALQAPEDDVLTARVVQQRVALQIQPDLRRHCVHPKLCVGRLERPRRVVDLGAQRLPLVAERVEAVALGEPVLERSRLRMRDGADRAIAPVERG